MKKAISARGRNIEAGSEYFAGALSLVFHPKHPYIPTFRADVRYFEVNICCLALYFSLSDYPCVRCMIDYKVHMLKGWGTWVVWRWGGFDT